MLYRSLVVILWIYRWLCLVNRLWCRLWDRLLHLWWHWLWYRTVNRLSYRCIYIYRWLWCCRCISYRLLLWLLWTYKVE